MVFKGRASPACNNCKTLHVKCDEKRPECSRCVRMKRPCTGYRDETDLMFCHSNVKSKERSRTPAGRNRICHSPKADSNLLHGSARLWIREESHVLLRGLGRVLQPSKEDLTLCFFYQTTMKTLTGSDRSQYLHRELPRLFSQSEPGSAFHLAVHAISHAVWARSWPNDINASQLARMSYLRSLSALNAAIRDRSKVNSDETLYTILLLSGYETITFNSETLSSWGTHVDGATALLKHRGCENFRTPLSCNMFLFIRRNALQSHLQMSTPIDPIFVSNAEILSRYENMEDQLLSKSMRIPQLLALANRLLSQTSCSVDVSKAFGLIQAAENLDRELANWAKSIPVKWSYKTVKRLGRSSDLQHSRSTFTPNQIHTYPDFYTARVWNLYRVYRLITQSILFRVSSCVNLDRIDDYMDGINNISRVMVEDVCASIPFLLGYDCSELKRSPDDLQDENSLWPQCSMKNASSVGHTGKFSLIWPLYVACSVSSDLEIQQRWMRAQLRWIAETGEAQAQLVQDGMSQTLAGRPENFRFDCV